ncbi:putative zinc-binding protein [bacterium]|nr:hypothetical protein [Candidatus Atribacteria bacterium]MBU1428327.1 putative zinc-binding protein [bacterium]MBU4047173.1 putative zinc-binding protein [bacterium]MBU4227922.1 putative zinc-binding protein [bacterium]MBU4562940.1 putative zinc-binding protein [bacterium]
MDKCCCNTKSRLIYSCSGAANTGEMADQISRKLAKEGYGNMTCLASVGAHISGFVESAKGADKNNTIDGYSVAYAKKILEHIGVSPTKSYALTEMGVEKGKTPSTEEIVSKISNKIKKDLSLKAEQENNTEGDKNKIRCERMLTK